MAGKAPLEVGEEATICRVIHSFLLLSSFWTEPQLPQC